MTFGEYANYQAPPGFRDQLIHGKVGLSPSPNRQHQDVCDTLHELLKGLVLAEYVVRMDTTHMLGNREGPRPDVFVIRKDRWIAADETGGFPEGSPELAIEASTGRDAAPPDERGTSADLGADRESVVRACSSRVLSPSNSARQMEDKARIIWKIHDVLKCGK